MLNGHGATEAMSPEAREHQYGPAALARLRGLMS